MRWSDEQEAIFSARDNTSDLIVVARAGTGKTTTILEMAKRIKSDWLNDEKRGTILFLAFNKSIASELSERLNSDTKIGDAKTFHSFGMGMCRSRAPGKFVKDNPIFGYVKSNIATKQNQLRAGDIRGTVSYLMNVGVKPPSIIGKDDYEKYYSRAVEARCSSDCESEEQYNDYLKAVEHCLDWSADSAALEEYGWSFDHMIWFPYIYGWEPKFKHKVVFVDEYQDLNPPQLYMAKKAGFRRIYVGDDRQAIYGWRGAMSQKKFLAQNANAETCKLTGTYRCAPKIVAQANQWVSDIRSMRTDSEGHIEEIDFNQFLDMVKPGDGILSRTNAPMVPLCLKFLSMNIPAQIRGRDIAENLVTRVKATNCKNLVEALDKAVNKIEKKMHFLVEKGVDVGQMADLVDCLTFFKNESEPDDLVVDFMAKIRGMFNDRTDEDTIVLSTVHKAKGLEWKKVFILWDTFKLNGPEEDNVKYVAVTRAKDSLYYVYGEEKED